VSGNHRPASVGSSSPSPRLLRRSSSWSLSSGSARGSGGSAPDVVWPLHEQPAPPPAQAQHHYNGFGWGALHGRRRAARRLV
jgi:hypothetical protein